MTTPGTTPGEACPCCLQAQEDIKAAVAEALADPLAMLRESLHYGRACGQLAEAVGMEASDLAIPADFVARAEKAIEEAAALLREKGDTHDA